MNENYIYKYVTTYDARIKNIPREDVMQEIRYALLIAREGDIFRECSRSVYRLLRDYGYRVKGKEARLADGYDVPDAEPDPKDYEQDDERLEYIRHLYMDEKYSVLQICGQFKVSHYAMARKLFTQVFPKKKRRICGKGATV